jgi:hypothetical protein
MTTRWQPVAWAYGRWAALLLADRVAHGKGPVRLAIKLRGKAKRPQRGRSLRFDGSGGALLRLETDWIEIALR